eukprot:snap_masked-scaffold_84-processed-gene-0.12-mRNA-1 protein AED:0.01 eAED:0.03 QI:0/-1/0/1/-1/1/1/0/338
MKLKLQKEIKLDSDRLWHCAWCDSKSLLAVSGTDKYPSIYYVKTGNNDGTVDFQQIAHVEDLHSKTIRCLEFSPNGKYLATVSFDATVLVYLIEGKSFELIANLEGHENEVKSLAWNRDGSMLASASRDKSIWVWEANNSSELPEVVEMEDWDCLNVLHGHTQDVKFVKYLYLEKDEVELLCSCGYDETIRFWKEIEEGEISCIGVFKVHESTIWQLDFILGPSNYVASCSQDYSVALSELTIDSREKNKVALQEISRSKEERCIYSICTSGQYIITGGGDNSIVIRQFADDKLEEVGRIEQAHDTDVNCVRWSSRLGLLASVSDDATLKVWTRAADE